MPSKSLVFMTEHFHQVISVICMCTLLCYAGDSYHKLYRVSCGIPDPSTFFLYNIHIILMLNLVA